MQGEEYHVGTKITAGEKVLENVKYPMNNRKSNRNKVFFTFYFIYAIMSNLVAVIIFYVLNIIRPRQAYIPEELACIAVVVLLYLLGMSFVMAKSAVVFFAPRKRITLTKSVLFILVFSFWYLPFSIFEIERIQILSCFILMIPPLLFMWAVKKHVK